MARLANLIYGHIITLRNPLCLVKMGAARFLVQVAIFLLVKPARSAPAPMRQGNSTASNSCSKASINNCSCRCELSPASTTANAVSALEDKIDQVIALANRTTPRHSAPGILREI